MKKIIVTKKNHVELSEDAIKEPDEYQVLIKTKYSAISSGTEKAIISGIVEQSSRLMNKDFGYPARAGGYSGVGIVEKVGSKVNDCVGNHNTLFTDNSYSPLKVGDYVMMHGGGHNEYTTLNYKELIKLPDNNRLDEAAFAVISGFSLAAVRKANIKIGESCMVVGLGLLGLHSIIYARLSGAYPIIAVDFDSERRKLALELGADFAIDPSDKSYKDDVLKYTLGKGADTVIEVTGNGVALTEALKCTARFGRVILLGCTRLNTEINFYFDVHCPGIQLIGAHSGARPQLESVGNMWTEFDDCKTILRYLYSDRISFKKLISGVCNPIDATEIYDKLVTDTKFPIGLLFDWEMNY